MTIQGMIKSIRLVNFMAFNDCILNVGEYLNLIIGPNGTGKSSVLCGIILGFGGTPSVTGRSSKLVDYIRNDCDRAEIEITLYKNESGSRLIKLARTITKKGETFWSVDDQNVDLKYVRKVLDEYHIQIENLCQFLPQERVQDFSKMNQKELLVSTLKAVCRLDILQEQNTVIQLSTTFEQIKKSSVNDVDNLKNLEEHLSVLKEKVNQFEERQDLLNKIQHLNGKMSWIKYSEFRDKMNELKKDKENAMKIVKDLKEKLKPLKETLKKFECDSEKYASNRSNKTQSLNRYTSEINEILDNCKTRRRTNKRQIKELEECRQRNEAFKKEIHDIDQSIQNQNQKLQDFVNQFGSISNIKQEIKGYCDQLTSINGLFKNLMSEQKSYEFQIESNRRKIQEFGREKAQFENFQRIQLDNLQRFNQQSYLAYQWIQSNQNLFRNRVYGPIIIEIDVLKPENAKYLEYVIPFQELSAFVCVDKDDLATLVTNLRNQQKLIVNVVYFSEDNLNSLFQPKYAIDELKQYGLYAYISDFFQAPDLVKAYLCRTFNVHNIPVGSHAINTNFMKLPPGIQQFFSDKLKYSVTISRYTKEKAIKTIDIRSRNILASRDHDRLRQIQKNIQDMSSKIEKLEHDLNEHNKKVAEKGKEKNSIMQQEESAKERLSEYDSAKNTISKLQTKRSRIESQIVSEKDAKVEIKKNFKIFIDSTKKNMDKTREILKTLIKYHTEFVKLKINNDTSRKQSSKVKDDIYIIQHKLDDHQRICEKIESEYDSVKQTAAQELAVAKKYTNGITPDRKAYKEFEDIYKTLPDSPVELKTELDRIYAKCKCMNIENENIFDEYANKQKQLADLKKMMEKSQSSLEKAKTDFETARDKWLGQLEALISEINNKFTDFFNRLDCKGEIAIYRGRDEKKYEDYGVSIRVTYRSNEPMKELDRFVQSGGERAVATAVYLLSLQDLTKAPFRWVDEINQGMDPTNELKIFQFLVEATSHKNSQYFFITPKLVKNLKISGNTRMHAILNGLGIKKELSQSTPNPPKKRKL